MYKQVGEYPFMQVTVQRQMFTMRIKVRYRVRPK